MTRLPTLAALAATFVLAACKAETRGDVAVGSGPSASAAASATVGGDSMAVGASAAAAPAPEGAAAPTAPTPGGFVDPNSASREQLAALPGMSATAADALVNGRPYADMLAVDAVLAKAGIAEAQRKALYAQLWKPLDLNSAKAEEILLIPGVGKKMQHEFEEYRPYKTIAQFRREMGKYVDDAEVARLERYVTIKESGQ